MIKVSKITKKERGELFEIVCIICHAPATHFISVGNPGNGTCTDFCTKCFKQLRRKVVEVVI